MDNTETTKPQQTGGLKLMTVFIAVLALHVLVIGGFTVYHLMGSGGDTDVALDKTHLLKADGTSVAEVAAPETTPADKPTDTPAPAPADNATPTPAPAATTTATLTNVPSEPTPSAPVTIAANPTPAPAPAPAPTPNPNAPLTITAPQIAQIAQDAQTATEASSLAPPPEPVPAELAPTSVPAPVPIKPATATTSTPKVNPTSVATTAAEAAPAANTETPGTLALGPVHMPAANAKPATAPTEEHVAAREHDAKHEFYTVKITDSYKKIARAHHITVAELKAANHIHDNVLHTGQKLIIPMEKSAVVKDDASPETGTASHVVLNESTSTASLSAEPTPVTEHHARHHLYTVEKGDTLKKIAQKFNTTTSALKEANNLHGTKLVAGEKLKIPTKEARSAALNPPAPLTPVPTPAQPNQVETQPTPIAPPAPPAAAPSPEPQSTPPSSPELANLTF
jgi:LysM repeat protein